MRRHTLAFLVSVTVLPALVPAAFAEVDTSRSVSFGDSLTHNDLLPFLFPPNTPKLYGADPFEAAFYKAADADDDLVNMAIVGSLSADVLDQVRAYVDLRRAGVLERATLISIQAGGNDVLDNIALFASAPPGTNREADCVKAKVLFNLFKGLLKLRIVDGKVDTVIWTIPDVTQIPLVQGMGLPAPALDNIRRHIEEMNWVIRFYGRRSNTAVLDLYRLLRRTVAKPPVLAQMTLIGPPAFGDFDHIFADPIHPTAVSNAILANGIIVAMNAKFDDNIPVYSKLELAMLAFPALAF